MIFIIKFKTKIYNFGENNEKNYINQNIRNISYKKQISPIKDKYHQIKSENFRNEWKSLSKKY